MNRRTGPVCLALPRPVARIGIVLSLGFLVFSVSVPALGARARGASRWDDSPWAHSARVHREPVLRVADADAMRTALQRWGWCERRARTRR